MSIIIDKLFPEQEVYSGFKNDEDFNKKHNIKKYINVENFFPSIILMVILRLLNISTNIVILSAIIIYFYITNTNINENKKKNRFFKFYYL